jgi:para-nitrobenzyl esterase
VGLLMLAPAARGLFHKAVEQSGTAGFGLPPRSLAQNEALGLDLARAVGAGDLAGLRAATGPAVLAPPRASSRRSPTRASSGCRRWSTAR